MEFGMHHYWIHHGYSPVWWFERQLGGISIFQAMQFCDADSSFWIKWRKKGRNFPKESQQSWLPFCKPAFRKIPLSDPPQNRSLNFLLFFTQITQLLKHPWITKGAKAFLNIDIFIYISPGATPWKAPNSTSSACRSSGTCSGWFLLRLEVRTLILRSHLCRQHQHVLQFHRLFESFCLCEQFLIAV